MYVLDLVNQLGRRKIEALAADAAQRGEVRNNPEDVETMPCFQTGLRDKLAAHQIDLSLPSQDMRYRANGQVTEQDLNAATAEIRRRLADKPGLIAYLENWAPLNKFVGISRAQQFEEMRTGFDDQLDELSAQAERGEINSGVYNAGAMNIAVQMKAASAGLRTQLVAELLKTHFGATAEA